MLGICSVMFRYVSVCVCMCLYVSVRVIHSVCTWSSDIYIQSDLAHLEFELDLGSDWKFGFSE